MQIKNKKAAQTGRQRVDKRRDNAGLQQRFTTKLSATKGQAR
jgi:hypothetical protein